MGSFAYDVAMRDAVRCGLLLLAACGRIDFAAVASSAGASDAIDARTTPPSAMVLAPAPVDGQGVSNLSYEVDGTHLLFVDNAPGKNGNLVLFREGDGTGNLPAYVSTDAGVTWTRYLITPGNATNINVLGACQDTVDHVFHMSWVDASLADQAMDLAPSYSGGDITGFQVTTHYQFFDDGADTPGPRDFAEVVDASGAHRLLFTGTAPSTGSTGLVKLAVTTPAIGLHPTKQDSWAPATNQTSVGNDDQLLPNNATTSDLPTTYMITAGGNVSGGPTSPAIVVVGLPADRKLIAWLVTPISGGNFTVSAPITLSTAFGYGNSKRANASLSLASAPSGETFVLYSEDTGSNAPGLHVAAFSANGALTPDRYPQPTTSATVEHGVIGVDPSSTPSVIYSDVNGALSATYAWDGGWLPAVSAGNVSANLDGAWALADPWQRGGAPSFGVYYDRGSSMSTTFVDVTWQ